MRRIGRMRRPLRISCALTAIWAGSACASARGPATSPVGFLAVPAPPPRVVVAETIEAAPPPALEPEAARIDTPPTAKPAPATPARPPAVEAPPPTPTPNQPTLSTARGGDL